MPHRNYNNYSISPLLIYLTFYLLRDSNVSLAFVVPVMRDIISYKNFSLFYYDVSIGENEFGESGRGMF
jgi:hypothetical protein